ncbi:DNA-directed RNA polymerase II subunit RPB1-like [Penaeus chinensis]|uniref:DNA-directed RNA polymerase II subunit RPB1-like n=1 Tax=Penaeus chinensis TaxID=139456 RepID=UPI001FB60820|nr:DNA-directed RNA polymerase II subunit RPB1-like [Penaeus chinensis]
MRLCVVTVLVFASSVFAKPTAQNVIDGDDGRLSVAIYDTGNPYYDPYQQVYDPYAPIHDPYAPIYDPYAPVYDPYNPYYDPYNPYYDPYNPYYDPYNQYYNPNIQRPTVNQRPHNNYNPYYGNNYYSLGNFIGGAVGSFLNNRDSTETSDPQEATGPVAF